MKSLNASKLSYYNTMEGQSWDSLSVRKVLKPVSLKSPYFEEFLEQDPQNTCFLEWL